MFTDWNVEGKSGKAAFEQRQKENSALTNALGSEKKAEKEKI